MAALQSKCHWDVGPGCREPSVWLSRLRCVVPGRKPPLGLAPVLQAPLLISLAPSSCTGEGPLLTLLQSWPPAPCPDWGWGGAGSTGQDPLAQFCHSLLTQRRTQTLNSPNRSKTRTFLREMMSALVIYGEVEKRFPGPEHSRHFAIRHPCFCSTLSIPVPFSLQRSFTTYKGIPSILPSGSFLERVLHT